LATDALQISWLEMKGYIYYWCLWRNQNREVHKVVNSLINSRKKSIPFIARFNSFLTEVLGWTRLPLH